MGLLSPDFDDVDDNTVEATQQSEIQYALFTERWRMAGYIELDSGTISDGFINYLKSQERTFADAEEIFGIVERLFIDSMTVRFSEAISR